MIETTDSPVIVLFAKKPIPGLVKTRLLDTYSEQQAADIASGLLLATVDRVYTDWPGKVIVSVWPDDDHPGFAEIKQNYDVEFTRQVPGDLGQKMLAVLRQGIESCGAAAVFGCDIPHIDADILKTAFNLLRDGQNIIGPTEDGGFYLLGLTQIDKKIFDNIEWGTESVFERTMNNLHDCEITKPETLATLRDIDTADDVAWALQSFDFLRDYLPEL